MKQIEIKDLPVTLDGRINWKEYFLDHAEVGDQFVIAKTMRSGIQRQAMECGFTAQSATIDDQMIKITVAEPDSMSKRILTQLAMLSEKQLIQIHAGCRQAKILPPL